MFKLLQATLLLLVILCNNDAQAAVFDKVIAVVNDEPIFLSELNEEGKPFFAMIKEKASAGKQAEELQKAKKEVLRQLIQDKLLMQEAKKYHISVTKDEVDEAVQNIIRENRINHEQFKEELAKTGRTEAQFRKDLQKQILKSKLVGVAVRSKVVVPQEKIVSYYKNKYAKDKSEEGYLLLQIGVSYDGDKEQARRKIENLHTMAKSGADFRALAKEYSSLPSAVDGGDIGVLSKEEMSTTMQQAVIGLAPGEISKIIETPAGFQFFKLVAKQSNDGTEIILDKEIEEEIRKILSRKEMDRLYRKWIEDVQSQAYIRVL